MEPKILEKKDSTQLFDDLKLIVKNLREENANLKTKLAISENQKNEIKQHFNKQIYGNVQAWLKAMNENTVEEFVIIPLKKFMELNEQNFKKVSGDYNILPAGKGDSNASKKM